MKHFEYMTQINSILKNSIQELKSTGNPTSELDARILLCEAIKKYEVFILTHPEYEIPQSDCVKFRRLIQRRKRGEPIAYILGHKEFFGYDFLVNKNTLVPRPETEWLVEEGIDYINHHLNLAPAVIPDLIRDPGLDSRLRGNDKLNNLNIIDIGTGSGNIILSLIKSLSTIYQLPATIKAFGVDTSRGALKVAKSNATRIGVENVNFYYSDLFSNPKLLNHFELILANLPYVPPRPRAGGSPILFSEMSTDHEPQNAIYAEQNGTAIIKEFLHQAKNRLSDGGLILIELDPRNSKELLEYSCAHFPTSDVKLQKDLAGLDRYLSISK